MTTHQRLEVRRWALPALCVAVAGFALIDHDWQAALGWGVAALGWASAEHYKASQP